MNSPLRTLLDELKHPHWLAELLLSGSLCALGLSFGSCHEMLGRVMPIGVWRGWLLLVGGIHVLFLFLGFDEGRWPRFACSIIEALIYCSLLLAFGVLSPSPKSVVAVFGVSFAVSIAIPFTLREKNGAA